MLEIAEASRPLVTLPDVKQQRYDSETGHWYDENGKPVYEVVGKNGKRRPTTLRDARKLNLSPSVTGIMRMAAAPALENWKREQLLESCLTLPKIEGETLEAFAERVRKDSEEQSKQAREIGTTLHGCIEKCLLGREDYDHNFDAHVSAALNALDKWCGLDGIEAEKSFCHELGFGGKCDVHKRKLLSSVADFKSKDFTEDNLPSTYETHDMQLAAYREGFYIPDARCAIIFVSTKVPGLTHLVEIDEDDLTRGWNMFSALLSYWQFQKQFTPSF